jgi:surfactin synthase thioesterase subunit
MASKSADWLVTPRPNPSAAVELIIFPYAGTGPAAFAAWSVDLDDWAQVSIVQLPGREARIDEPAMTDARAVAAEIAKRASELVAGRTLFFGYSLGSLLAYETCKVMLEDYGSLPYLVAVCSRSPPYVPMRSESFYSLPRDQFLTRVRKLGGMSQAVLSSPQLVNYFEPILRADLKMNDLHPVGPPVPLGIPVIAFAGARDEDFPVADVSQWRAVTTDFEMHVFDGGHFFIQDFKDQVQSRLREAALRHLKLGHGKIPIPRTDTNR